MGGVAQRMQSSAWVVPGLPCDGGWCSCSRVLRVLHKSGAPRQQCIKANFAYDSLLLITDVRYGRSDFRCIAAGDAPGKSASSFFFTADQAYVFKSCTKKDTACLLKLLPKYLAYVEGHEATLLPRYVGLFEASGAPLCSKSFYD